MMSTRRVERGFTLVELTISMAIASIAIVALMQALIQLYHIYEANIAIRATQQTARAITKEIGADARDAATAIVTTGAQPLWSVDGSGSATLNTAMVGKYRTCLFSTQSSDGSYDGAVFYLRSDRTSVSGVQPVDLYRHPFATTKLPGGATAPSSAACQAFAVNNGADDRLNGNEVSILAFNGTINSAAPSLLNLNLSAGALYALDFVNFGTNPPTCGSGAGSQYCSVTSLATAVQTRGTPQ